jgi:uncharacterized alkaline shock family protein YloU
MPIPEHESTNLESVPISPPSSVKNDGTTTISDQVVAKIAGTAAREIEGVHELTASGLSGAISVMANKMSGADAPEYGVRVQVGQLETIIHLAMIINYGSSIPKVAQAVRKSVSTQIREMTGLLTREVNIAVTDVAFPDKSSTPHQLQ